MIKYNKELAENTTDLLLNGEEWRDMIGFEDVYEISSFGRVKTKYRVMYYDRGLGRGIEPKTVYPRIRKQKINKHTGYKMVGLNSKGKSKNYTIHSLVGEAFHGYVRGQGISANSNSMNHIDGNKFNNFSYNLENIDLRDNVVHMFETGLSTTNHRISYKGEVFRSKAKFREKFNISERKLKKLIKDQSKEVDGIIYIDDFDEDKRYYYPIFVNNKEYKSKAEVRKIFNITEKKLNKLIETNSEMVDGVIVLDSSIKLEKRVDIK